MPSNQFIKKEELQTLLEQYKPILNHEVIEYLTELLELKTSVIKEMQLKLNQNKMLRELSLYKQIAIYNIYYRALYIAKKAEIEPIISEVVNLEELSLFTKIGEDCMPLFLFHVGKEETKKKSIIDLYRTTFDVNVRNQVLSEMKAHLQNLWGEHWNTEIEDYCLFHYYNDLIKKLEMDKELSKRELRQMELTQQMQQLLIEDYGLTQDSFVDENADLLKQAKSEEEKHFLRCKFALENHTSPYAIKPAEKEIILVKKIPNMEIRNVTKYIL